MNVTDMYVKIILAIISIISALISAYVIPFLRSKIQFTNFALLNDFVIDSVRAANQLYTKEQWQEKKQYVLDLVNNYLNGSLNLGLDESQIDAIIEGIVREIKVSDGDIVSGNNNIH